MRDTPASRIRRARDAAGLTRRRAARILGIHPSDLELAESGRASLPQEVSEALARLCHVSPDDVLPVAGAVDIDFSHED